MPFETKEEKLQRQVAKLEKEKKDLETRLRHERQLNRQLYGLIWDYYVTVVRLSTKEKKHGTTGGEI